MTRRPHWFEPLADRMGSSYLRYAFTKGTDQEAAFIADLLDLPAGAVVVDLGCGPGRHTRALAGHGLTAVGVDLARRFLEVARDASDGPSGASADGADVGQLAKQSAGRPAGWLRADAARLPLADASADAVVSLCQGAFGVPPVGAGDDVDRAILDEAARVLRPGGRLVLSAFSAYFQVRWLEDQDTFDAAAGRNHETTVVHDETGASHPAELWTTCFTPRELRLMAAAAGLTAEAVWSVTPGDYQRREPTVELPEFLLVARRNGP
jgi:SAM-dependent methyltransferase